MLVRTWLQIRSNINCACSKVFFTHRVDALCCACFIQLLCSSCLTLYCPNNYLEILSIPRLHDSSEKRCWGNELCTQTSQITLTLSRFPFYFPHMLRRLLRAAWVVKGLFVFTSYILAVFVCHGQGKLECKLLERFDKMYMKSCRPLTKVESTYDGHFECLRPWICINYFRKKIEKIEKSTRRLMDWVHQISLSEHFNLWQ